MRKLSIEQLSQITGGQLGGRGSGNGRQQTDFWGNPANPSPRLFSGFIDYLRVTGIIKKRTND